MSPDLLCGIVPEERVLQDEPMALHTTFEVGGPASLFVTVQTEEELLGVLRALRKAGQKAIVIGKGSNLLVSDRGINAAIVHCDLCDATVQDGILTAQAGISLRKLYEVAVQNGLTALEFASGIPGSLGGAVVMNAGAYGGEMKDVVQSVRVADKAGNVFEIDAADMEFGYRTSIVSKEGYTVLGAKLALPKGDTQASRALAAKFAAARRAKQPVDKPSAGSTFKRPAGNFAGTLIQSCGLKGARVGSAQVSDKHAGFVINAGGATASDVYGLIRQVQHTVQVMTGIHLEPEIKFLGDF